MTFTIKGNVKSVNNEYFTCLQFPNLSVQIYEAPYNTTPSYLDSTGVNNDGTFSKEVTSTAKAFQLKLYDTSVGTSGLLLAESAKFCPHDNISIDFNVDESTASDPVFNIVLNRLDDAGVSDDDTINKLTAEQIGELSCNLCVNEKTLMRLRNAHLLWDLFSNMTPPDAYTETATPWSDFTSSPDTSTADERGKKIFFALLKSGSTRDINNKAVIETSVNSGTGEATATVTGAADSTMNGEYTGSYDAGTNTFSASNENWQIQLESYHDGSSASGTIANSTGQTAGEIPDFSVSGTTTIAGEGVIEFVTNEGALKDLFTNSREQFDNKIENAADLNEIDDGLNSSTNLNNLEACRDALLLNSEDDGAYYDAKIIHLSDNTYGDKSDLLDSSLDDGGLMGIPPTEPPDDHLTEALKIKTISEVLLNYAPFLDAFIADRGRDLDYFDLTSDGPGPLETLITSSGALPPAYATAADYADAIYKPLGEGNPSARMVYALDGAGTSIPSGSDISDLLTDNQDFNVREHSAAVFFTTETGQPNTISETLMDDLLSLQRSSRLAGDTNDLGMSATLISTDLDSSSAIVNMGEETFMRTMGGLGTVSPDTAGRVYATARGIDETARMMAWNYLRYEGPYSLMPRALGNNLTLPGSALPSGLPNLQTLFGSLNTCTCEHCQSVYGPAAYLTDLLNWLRRDVVMPAPSTVNGFDALETMGTYDRRKDIKYILLTCQNTNTMLPYIDIVNEILSVELLLDAGATAGDLLAARQSLQTIGTTEEIMTEPEHRFHLAELKLKDYFYTWVLPYNVAYDEVLSYMKISGMEYHEIVTNMSSAANKYDEIRWARTVLNIHPEELSLYVNTNYTSTTFWLDYYGFGGMVPVPPYVGSVLNVTELSVTDLKKELYAYYINGSSNITIVPDDDLCNVDSYLFDPDFTAEVAERFMKLFRLRRKAGLSVWEMDVAIATFTTTYVGGGTSGIGIIDNGVIQKLAAAVSFSKQYHIDFGDLMVMMGDKVYQDLITPTTYSDYYKNKFINPLLPSGAKTFFETGMYSFTIGNLTNLEKNYMSNIMKVSIPAINEIISVSGLTAGTNVTLVSLAKIHRYALFMNVFGLKHTELSDAISWFGNIFSATNKIKKAFEFGEALNNFRRLNTPILTFKDIANASGDYLDTSPKLMALAEKSWKSTEKAFQEARKANPDKDANDIANQGFYTDVLKKDIALQFDLQEDNVEDIINEESSTWFADFIDDPDGTVTTRDWTNKDSDYIPIYRLINRIVLLSKIFGFENVTGDDGLAKISLEYGIETEIDGSMDVPGTAPFYWMKSDYTAVTAGKVAELVWVKNVSRQAKILDLPQRDNENSPPVDLYTWIDDYYNNSANWNTVGYTQVSDVYESLGENSPYAKLSVHEFAEIFKDARLIASATNDLLEVFDIFERIHYVTQVFNIKAADAWGWVWTMGGMGMSATTIDYDMSADVKRAIHSKYTSFSAWSDAIVPVQNGLRSRMRDAFVGLYIAKRGFADANKIYEYYLLDTQMAPCMKTSRIVQAISSVQLLVHRGLLNLETYVKLDEGDKQEWQWRKNYRVWEANRKVFLYPENWIEPSLRKNKTELFKAAEEFLQQDDINDRNTEQAYNAYLTGLNDVSHLDIRAVYVEDPNANLANGDGMVYKNSKNEIYHVFARNWNPPYTYYYRKFEDGVWQGWEKMDIEIDSDHLVPAIFNRKLYLFFPVFREKIWDNKPENKYFEIQLAYTKYDFGKWSQKKIFKETLYSTPICYVNNVSTPNDPAFGEKFWDHESFWNSQTNNSVPGRTDLNNNYYQTWSGFFSMATMEKSDFYFWSENLSNGGLKIHVRRVFDSRPKKALYLTDSYTEMAFELNFVLNPVDERAHFEADTEFFTASGNPRFFLARPYMTKPYFQQMIHGVTYKASGGPSKLFSKMNPVMSADTAIPLLNNAAGYTLTFPQQFKHSYFKQPFFFNHSNRSYFFRSIW